MIVIKRVLTEAQRISWIQLARTKHISISVFYDLIKIYSCPIVALRVARKMLAKAGKRVCAECKILEEMEYCEKKASRIICACDDEYPRSLIVSLYDPPPVITVAGDINALSYDLVAIVGSRNASIASINFAKKIAYELWIHGVANVSGLARGIDSAVHLASVNQDAPTVAVIGNGMDVVYPRENFKLYEQIKKNGLIITEYDFFAKPIPSNFPRRNRIIAALALGVVVVEGTTTSGSLITAYQGLEMGKEIFAVPGFPLDKRYSGTNKLIKSGAILVESADSILDVVRSIKSDKMNDLFAKRDEEDHVFKPVFAECDAIKDKILNSLTSSFIEIDDVIMHLGLETNIALVAIVELELSDLIVRDRNMIALCTAKQSVIDFT